VTVITSMAHRAVTGCALLLLVSGCGGSSRSTAPSSTYGLMQMNLCLSGLAPCYDPTVVDEAMARIRADQPDAVTFNEACRSDVMRIARQTGYHARFSRVIYRGELLRCVRPGGRGLFGIAVLTRAAVERADSQDFAAQARLERRRCAELATLLERRAGAHTVIFGGDVNRRDACAPDGFWSRTDASAGQAPGLQHVYGSGALRSPAADVVPAAHTDHDVLFVAAQLRR
jgi:hypothetical protein